MTRIVLIIALIFVILFPSPFASASALLGQIPAKEGGLAGKMIVIDPGHGGSDPGAIGLAGVKEKDITLGIGLELRRLLIASGTKVILTRTYDRDVAAPGSEDAVELQARADIATAAGADLLVSIHADAFEGLGAGGTTTYYSPVRSDSGRLAETVQTALAGSVRLEDRGTRGADFYLLRHVTMPAILTEVAFVSNPFEEKLLTNRSFQARAAQGILAGLRNYYKSAPKDGNEVSADLDIAVSGKNSQNSVDSI